MFLSKWLTGGTNSSTRNTKISTVIGRIIHPGSDVEVSLSRLFFSLFVSLFIHLQSFNLKLTMVTQCVIWNWVDQYGLCKVYGFCKINVPFLKLLPPPFLTYCICNAVSSVWTPQINRLYVFTHLRRRLGFARSSFACSSKQPVMMGSLGFYLEFVCEDTNLQVNPVWTVVLCQIKSQW